MLVQPHVFLAIDLVPSRFGAVASGDSGSYCRLEVISLAVKIFKVLIVGDSLPSECSDWAPRPSSCSQLAVLSRPHQSSNSRLVSQSLASFK